MQWCNCSTENTRYDMKGWTASSEYMSRIRRGVNIQYDVCMCDRSLWRYNMDKS